MNVLIFEVVAPTVYKQGQHLEGCSQNLMFKTLTAAVKAGKELFPCPMPGCDENLTQVCGFVNQM